MRKLLENLHRLYSWSYNSRVIGRCRGRGLKIVLWPCLALETRVVICFLITPWKCISTMFHLDPDPVSPFAAVVSILYCFLIIRCHCKNLGTVERSSWHGEPDLWAFQQHSSCTADIPGTGGSSYLPSFALGSCAMFAFASSFFHLHSEWGK